MRLRDAVIAATSIGGFEAVRIAGTTDPDSIGIYRITIWDERGKQ